MMIKMEKMTKPDAEKKVKKFFKILDNKTPKEIKKIKRLSMKHNIKLGVLRKKFCKKCYFPLTDAEIRIKQSKKIVKCRNCGYVSRWKIK